MTADPALARIRRPKAVFLDIGGPVYDDENFFRAAVTALAELRTAQGLGPVPESEIREVYDSVRTRQAGSIRRGLAERFLGAADLAPELSRRTKAHWTHPSGSLLPDVIPFLEAIRPHAVIGLVANQEAGVVDDLTRDGVAPFIDVWGVSALVGVDKPSPELFSWALERAGVEAGEAVHIGNRLDTDVRPAASLGIGTVWILRGEAPDQPTPEQRAEPDLVVDSLAGLAETLFP